MLQTDRHTEGHTKIHINTAATTTKVIIRANLNKQSYKKHLPRQIYLHLYKCM